MILLIDNYDSFVHNLARYLSRLGQETMVVRNDVIDAPAVMAMRPAAVLLSPGPCTPHEAGCSLDVVRACVEQIPILGVCLGHQAICAALGGRIVRAPAPMHGRTSRIHHDGVGVFRNAPNPLVACRYHSLVVEEASLPDCLHVAARADDGAVMAVAHRRRPVVGLQFHPESILTESGYLLLANFLKLAGIAIPQRLPTITEELRLPAAQPPPLPAVPIPY